MASKLEMTLPKRRITSGDTTSSSMPQDGTSPSSTLSTSEQPATSSNSSVSQRQDRTSPPSRLSASEQPAATSATSSVSQRWHPKISTYRLLVVSLTIGIGTAKAITTFRGGSVVPITLEWVSGIIMVLLFYFLEIYENHQTKLPPSKSSWFFHGDLLTYVWKVLGRFSIAKPVYSTNEESDSDQDRNSRPLVTGYRLIVTLSAVTFGVTKATLGYLGFVTLATSAEWVFGSLFTTCLYVLGLYARSPNQVIPLLFSTDCKPFLILLLANTQSLFKLSLYPIGLTAMVVLIILQLTNIKYIWRHEAYSLILSDRRKVTPVGFEGFMTTFARAYWTFVNIFWAIIWTYFLLFLAHSGWRKLLQFVSRILKKSDLELPKPLVTILRRIAQSVDAASVQYSRIMDSIDWGRLYGTCVIFLVPTWLMLAFYELSRLEESEAPTLATMILVEALKAANP